VLGALFKKFKVTLTLAASIKVKSMVSSYVSLFFHIFCTFRDILVKVKMGYPIYIGPILKVAPKYFFSKAFS